MWNIKELYSWNDRPNNKENNNLSNSLDLKKLFLGLKKSKWISEKFFVNQLIIFKKNNKDWYKIFENLLPKLKWLSLDNTKDVLAFSLLVQNVYKNKWSKTEKFLKFQIKNVPTKIIKIIKWLYDDITDLQKVNKLNQKENKLNQKKDNSVENKEITNNQIKKTVEKIKNKINNLSPESKKKYKKKLNQIKEVLVNKWIKNENEAYLLAFASLRKKDFNFSKEIWTLDQTTKLVLLQIENKYWNLMAEKIVWTKQIEQQINNFVSEKTVYDEKIKNSLKMKEYKLNYKEQAKLTRMYPNFVDKIFDKITTQIWKEKTLLIKSDYEIYLQTWIIKKQWEKQIFEKIFLLLQKKFYNDMTTLYISKQKKIAVESYTKSLFSMLYQTLWLSNVSKWVDEKLFDISDKTFQLEKDWKLKFNFKYSDTPLELEVTPEWEIYMTNYLARKNQLSKSTFIKSDWAFELKKTKLNNFFSIVWLKTLLIPNEVDISKLISEKNPKQAIVNNILLQTNKKLEKNLALWNKEFLKAEMHYEINKQSITHNFLKLYKPSVDDKYLKWIKWEVAPDLEPFWLFNLLNSLDKTLKLNKNSFVFFEQFFNSQKILDFFKNLNDTSDFFEKSHIILQWKLHLKKLLDLKSWLEKWDINLLPYVEWYKREKDNWKITLKEEQNNFVTHIQKINEFIKNK